MFNLTWIKDRTQSLLSSYRELRGDSLTLAAPAKAARTFVKATGLGAKGDLEELLARRPSDLQRSQADAEGCVDTLTAWASMKGHNVNSDIFWRLVRCLRLAGHYEYALRVYSLVRLCTKTTHPEAVYLARDLALAVRQGVASDLDTDRLLEAEMLVMESLSVLRKSSDAAVVPDLQYLQDHIRWHIGGPRVGSPLSRDMSRPAGSRESGRNPTQFVTPDPFSASSHGRGASAGQRGQPETGGTPSRRV